jgi:IS30 family transposase
MSESNHTFNHLSIAEREEIAILNSNGAKVAQIASKLGRSPSTISRELRRYKNIANYRACLAQTRADTAKRRCRKPRKSDNCELLHKIERMLKRRWSPKIIVQKLGHIISHTTIYNIIYTIRTEWRKFLIYQRKGRYRKGSGSIKGIPFRTNISERPALRFGDWEADTVISSRGGRSCVAVFAEKITRIYRVVKMPNKSAKSMTGATLDALRGLPVNSITYDNGTENADHWITNMLLGCASYFCRAYRSSDKGLVENRNKILRQYLPKGTNFDLITDDELVRIEKEINERPMEVLGWLSPNEALVLQSVL